MAKIFIMHKTSSPERGRGEHLFNQWIGLGEHLQDTRIFHMKIHGVLQTFP